MIDAQIGVCEIKRLRDVDVMSVSKLFFVLLILFVFAVPIFVLKGHASSQDVAASAISQAEEVLVSAYEAVKEAEMAGADISGFSELLRDAAQLLAQAHTSFRVGDFDSAVLFANLTSEIGKDVEVKVIGLGARGYGLSMWQMYLTMVKSLFAVVVVVLASFWSWGVFKRLYHRRIRVMKPEVASDGS